MDNIQIMTLLITFMAIYAMIIGWTITRDLHKILTKKEKEEEKITTASSENTPMFDPTDRKTFFENPIEINEVG
jgi:hypothetical protein